MIGNIFWICMGAWCVVNSTGEMKKRFKNKDFGITFFAHLFMTCVGYLVVWDHVKPMLF